MLTKLPSRNASAFTLIEVMAGMALLVCLIGSVYGIADGTLRLGTSLSTARVSDARVNHLFNQWRAGMENLGAGAKLTALNNGERQEILVEDARPLFAWNRAGRTAAATRLIYSESSAALTVQHLKRNERGASDDYLTVGELPLVEGVSRCTWEFYDAETKEWQDHWIIEERLPALMKVRCVFSGEPFPAEATFAIPGGAVKSDKTPSTRAR